MRDQGRLGGLGAAAAWALAFAATIPEPREYYRPAKSTPRKAKTPSQIIRAKKQKAQKAARKRNRK